MRDFEARFAAIKEAKWGTDWKPVTDIAFEVAAMILNSPAMYKFPQRPGIFPTPSGGLVLELLGRFDTEIEISPLGIITGNTELFGLGSTY